MYKSELQTYCEEMGISVFSRHLYLDASSSKIKDVWESTVRFCDDGDVFLISRSVFHRKLSPGIMRDSFDKTTNFYFNDQESVFGEKEACEKGFLILQDLNLIDIISNILLDTIVCNISFYEWCERSVTRNSDSITDLNSYLAHQKNGSKLIKLVGHNIVEVMKNKAP